MQSRLLAGMTFLEDEKDGYVKDLEKDAAPKSASHVYGRRQAFKISKSRQKTV